MTKPSWLETAVLLVLFGLAGYLLQHDLVTAQTPAKPPVYSEFRSRLALDGHDPVAYFASGKPAKGLAEHALVWKGATWHFVSADNKKRFEASPEAFAPQYGGYCAWALSEGYTAKGDPANWRIVDGRLYLNYNASVQKNWEKNIPGHIAKGDGNWPKVLSK